MKQTLAARLREAREYLGYSQEQVAAHLGLPHRVTLTEIEAGRRKITAEEFAKLCKLYQRHMDWFLGGEITTGLPATLVESLSPEDRSQVEEFARFLQWRKKQVRSEP